MTGAYPATTGCYKNGHPWPTPKHETFMHALGRSGWTNYGVGKVHFEPEEVRDDLNGFTYRERQEEIVSDPNTDEYMQFLQANGGDYVRDPHGVRGEMYYIPQPAQMPAQLHPTQWIGDRTVNFIENKARDSEPWFLFSSFIHPHPPFCPPAPWHKLYRDVDTPSPNLPPDYEKLLVYVNHYQNRTKRRHRGWDLNLVRMIRAYYYACISFIDYQVGRILDSLEKTGQLDNTLILFSSDHGELLGDFGSFGKRSYHDAAMRVPLLARHPQLFQAGNRCDTPVNLIDIAATILARAGTSFATHKAEGADLVDIARGEHADRTIFTHYNQGQEGLYCAINREAKFVFSAPDQRELFFDRVADPLETRDIIDVQTGTFGRMKHLSKLRDALKEHLRDRGETAALDGDDWRKYPIMEMPKNPDVPLLYQDHPWADHSIPGYTDNGHKAEDTKLKNS